MTDDQRLDSQWKQWYEVMREGALLLSQGDADSALLAVDGVLGSEISPEIRSDALGFRALLKEELGDLEAASEDLRSARSLVGPGYARYVHELSLANMCQKQGLFDDAQAWYRIALRTCVEGEHTSCGSALAGFLELQNNNLLTPEDRQLCTQAAQRSWQILALPGELDLTDLAAAASRIKDGETSTRQSRRR
jgi:hypothetical protein